MSIILGISGGFIHRTETPAACLVINGHLKFAQEEERFIRYKNARGLMPTQAIKEALAYMNLNIKEVDYVTFNSSYQKLKKKIENYFLFNFGYCPKLKLIDHHTCHAYSAYFPSGYKEANIITADFSGNSLSTTISVGKKTKVKRIKVFKKPNSLGIFYGIITQALGFEIDNDEYKVMGLASYGKAKYNLDTIIRVTKKGYYLNKKNISPNELKKTSSMFLTRQEPFYSRQFLKNLNLKGRMSKNIYNQKKADIAASAQKKLNLAAESIFNWAYQKTGIKNFCIAGGVGLNCSMNHHLSRLKFVNRLYVQPASSDAGCSIGGAIYLANKLGENIKVQNKFYLGNSYKNIDIKKILKNNNLFASAKKYSSKFIALELSKSKIVAIFQGRHEFGPRALGNRSILANPKNIKMKKILNKKIKYRETFRPFAPVVLAEDANKYFYLKKGIDYSSMTVTCHVKKIAKKKIPACVHVDNTSRVQVIEKGTNKKIENLLKEFGKITSDPVLINTSFNLNKQPNVNTPEDAISTFYSSGIDHLVLENYILSK